MSIGRILQKYSSISLLEMDKVALMKRVDTKFILNKEQLKILLDELADSYSVLDINGLRSMNYSTRYYDTEQFQFYFHHHNQLAKRVKVRSRTYVDSDLSFLEIKQKDIKGRTIKSRIKTDNKSTSLSDRENEFISQTIGPSFDLQLSLRNSFYRTTLVGIDETERVTIDTELSYNENSFNPELVIIELKQEKLNPASKMYQSLKKLGIRPLGMSKYCIGISKNNPDLKQNNFKPKFLAINKITS